MLTYRPPQGNIDNFCQYFHEILDGSNAFNGKELVIMGDCNINYLETHDPKTKKLKDTMRFLGLKQHTNEPTYFGMRNSCLDLIFSNSDLIDNSGTFRANISDQDDDLYY